MTYINKTEGYRGDTMRNRKELSIMAWNVNARAGYMKYKIPRLVTDTILKVGADIVVLNEFVRASNWSARSRQLAEVYDRYTYKGKEIKRNEILICIKKNRGIEVLNVNRKMSGTVGLPVADFLELDIMYRETKIKIAGIRLIPMLTEAKKRIQMENLVRHLCSSEVDKVVCIGDFNATSGYLSRLPHLKRNGYVVNMAKEGRFSFVHGDGNRVCIDNMITRGIKVRDFDYSWGFVSEENGYRELQSYDAKSINHLPDHAIVTAKLDVM